MSQLSDVVILPTSCFFCALFASEQLFQNAVVSILRICGDAWEPQQPQIPQSQTKKIPANLAFSVIHFFS
jgi:hypothetical protein